MELSIEQVRKRYDVYSRFYDYGPFNFAFEKIFYRKWRKRILGKLEGRVLEIGIGTGTSLPYYDYKKVRLTAVDVSKGMLLKAAGRARRNNFHVTFRQVPAEKLPFKDDSFDYVVTACVLCSVADPIRSLKEMARVCRKNGKLVMVEHMLSRNRIIALLEHIHNPLTSFFFGYNINRDTIGNIRKAGLKIVKERNLAFYDMFRELEAMK